MVARNPLRIRKMRIKPSNLVAIALQKDIQVIEHIDNQPAEVIDKLLEHRGDMLAKIKHPTEEQCLLSVRQNGNNLKLVPTEMRTEKVIMTAIEVGPRDNAMLHQITKTDILGYILHDYTDNDDDNDASIENYVTSSSDSSSSDSDSDSDENSSKDDENEENETSSEDDEQSSSFNDNEDDKDEDGNIISTKKPIHTPPGRLWVPGMSKSIFSKRCKKLERKLLAIGIIKYLSSYRKILSAIIEVSNNSNVDQKYVTELLKRDGILLASRHIPKTSENVAVALRTDPNALIFLDEINDGFVDAVKIALTEIHEQDKNAFNRYGKKWFYWKNKKRFHWIGSSDYLSKLMYTFKIIVPFCTREIISHVLSLNGMCLELIGQDLLSTSLCKIALKSNPASIEFVNDTQFRNKHEKGILSRDGNLLRIFGVSPHVDTALENHPMALEHIADPTLKQVIKAVSANPYALKCRCIHNDPDRFSPRAQIYIVHAAVNINGCTLQYAPIQNREVAMLAIKQNKVAIKYVTDDIKKQIKKFLKKKYKKQSPEEFVRLAWKDYNINCHDVGIEFEPEPEPEPEPNTESISGEDVEEVEVESGSVEDASSDDANTDSGSGSGTDSDNSN